MDTVLNRWYENDLSRKVKNLPDENDLSWFLICGIQDQFVTHPAYQVFIDSLDAYGIGYDYNFFEGGHEYDPESWIMAINWLDSIIDHSYQTIGIPDYRQTFRQFAVYPNPVSDLLTISYQLNEGGMIQMSIFNIYGQQMETAKNEFQPAGENRVLWNISTYPQGVYFCCLQVENEMITKKIIKVK